MHVSRYFEIMLCFAIITLVIINPKLIVSIPNKISHAISHAIIDLAGVPDETQKALNDRNVDELVQHLLFDFESYIIKFPNALSYDTTILLGDGKITNLKDNDLFTEEVSRDIEKMEIFMEEQYKARRDTVFDGETTKENIIQNMANQYLYLYIVDGEYQLSTAKELIAEGETLK